MKTEINVEFCLYGDALQPDEVTKQLQMHPSFHYQKGDPMKANSMMPRLEGCWEIETGYAPSVDIHDGLSKMKDMLEDQAEKIVEMKRAHKLGSKVTIVIRIHENEVPSMYLSSSILSFIVNDLEAEMDICTYIY
ncbi:DUF4279 domain-containing protein [Bacillus sp. RO3]|nr:DUF4279 domain-containing protein [Bacillus sp. RO3]